MKIKTIIICLLISNILLGQKAWFRHLDGWGACQSFVIADTIYSFSSQHIPFNNKEKGIVVLTLTKTNSTFIRKEIITLDKYSKDSSFSTQLQSDRCIDFHNGIFYIGLLFSNDKIRKSYLIKYKPLIGIQDTINIKKGTINTYIQHLIVINDNPILFGKYDYSNSSSDTRYESFIKYLRGSVPTWFKLYPFTISPYYDWQVTSTFSNRNDKMFYFVQRYQQIDRVSQDYVVKMDTSGSEYWRVAPSFPRDSINPAGMQVIEKPNGNLLVSWCDYEYRANKNPAGNPYNAQPNYNATVWFAEFDQNGILIWKKNIRQFLQKASNSNYTGMIHTKVIPVGEINAIVYTGNYINNKRGYVPYLLKTDYNGNPIWYREYNIYPQNDAYSNNFYSYDVTSTQDGGFLLTGSYSSSEGNVFPSGCQKSTIIKLDYNGCLIPGCENPNGIKNNRISRNKCKVYPNPASEKVIIELPKENFNKVQIRLYSISGRLIKDIYTSNTNEINTSSLEAGIYFVIVNNLSTLTSETFRISIIH